MVISLTALESMIYIYLNGVAPLFGSALLRPRWRWLLLSNPFLTYVDAGVSR